MLLKEMNNQWEMLADVLLIAILLKEPNWCVKKLNKITIVFCQPICLMTEDYFCCYLIAEAFNMYTVYTALLTLAAKKNNLYNTQLLRFII